MTILRQLLLIIWKGNIVRRRHFIVTGFELLIPLILVFVFTYIRSMAMPSESGFPDDIDRYKVHNATFYSAEEINRIRVGQNVTFLYVPNSPTALELVQRAALKAVDNPSANDSLQFKGFDSYYEMNIYYIAQTAHTYNWNIYGVSFHDMKDKLPDSLDYTIRVSDNLYTAYKYPQYSWDGPAYSDQYQYSRFLAMQDAIDKAYIEMKSGKELERLKVYLQRYPYPKYVNQSSKFGFITILPYFVVYGIIILMAVFVKRVIDEKTNRAKEMMRMMGLNDFVYFFGVFLNAYFLLFIVFTISIFFYSFGFGKGLAPLYYSNGFIFWIGLNLYGISSLLFCLALSTFFNKAVLGAILTFFLWPVTHVVPTMLMDPPGNSGPYAELKLGPKLASCLLPNCAFHFICKIFGNFESNKLSLSWNEMNKGSSPDDDLSLSMVYGMMLVSMVIYSFIIWYVDNVWPWQPGMPKNPAFLFMPSYWCPTRSIKKQFDTSFENKGKYFEDEPEGQAKGIELQSLSKVFGMGSSRKVAVDSVSLSMYKGQITVLLGHNGAGKTTTMNILTGLYAPSSGSAFIDGYDISTATKRARQSLGLCPQHNVLYDNLTVEEHLKFFAGLKGMTFAAMPSEITTVLQLLDLMDKRTTLSSALSGGMKRKLSLGIAMVASSQVLVLDEPTSGMDPQARRAVWDLLQKIRTERTVLLTTHYMEEADVLGDRIAIMSEGKVQCAGSPLFLKRALGAGYNVRFAKGNNFETETVTNIIKSHVSEAFLNTETAREACYILPTNDAEPFVEMFDEIERQKQTLGFNSFGLSITTMEDVFIKAGELSEKPQETVGGRDDNTLNEARESIIIDKPLQGFSLMMSRIHGLMLKRFHDTKRYKAFLIFQFILPIIISVALLIIARVVDGDGGMTYPPLKLNLNEIFGSTKAFYSGNVTELVDSYQRVLESNKAEAIENSDPIKEVLIVGNEKLINFKQNYLVAGAFNRNPIDGLNLTALYNGEPYHCSALSVNLMNNALLRYHTGDASKTISVTNHPFQPRSYSYDYGDNAELGIRMIISCFMPMTVGFLSASFTLFPIHERLTKSKLLQRMTGIGGLLFWTMHFIWDYLSFIVAAVAIIITFTLAADPHVLRHDNDALGTIFLLLVLYGWSAIPFNYILSFRAKKPSTGFVFASGISSATGMILNIVTTVYRLIAETPDGADKLAFLFRLFPDFSITWGISNVYSNGRKNGYCSKIDPIILEYFCPVWFKSNPHSTSIKCCPDQCGRNSTPCDKPVPYISWEPTAAGRDILFMILTGFIYFGILIILETNFLRLWYIFQTNILPRFKKSSVNENSEMAPTLQSTMRHLIAEDPDVSLERSRVETLFEARNTATEALAVLNLSKTFGGLQAVDHLTFSLHKDECFGLLGVNGAGKTTTFGMLTGDLMLGDGNACIGSYNVRDDLKSFQSCLGYCPQFDALLDRMTGREALYLFARLRGMPASEIEHSVAKIINMVDLKPHADKTAEKYSGGNRRKLSLALALIGGPPVVFLDEPTAGVDPSARRKIWSTFTNVQNIGGMSFILTTHSMEECEALCARLAIMVNGQFRCIGSIQDLKHKFGQGYTLIVKLKKEYASSPEHTNTVCQHLQNTFANMHLKDEHQGLLHYHLMDNSVPWSVLFRELEKTKKMYQLEDYLISDTTLEQIFLAFAKTQRVTGP